MLSPKYLHIPRASIDPLTLPQSTGCKPIADIDSFTEDKLGAADLIEEDNNLGSRLVKVTGVRLSPLPPSSSTNSSTSAATTNGTSTTTQANSPSPKDPHPRTVSLVVRGANSLILDEAERSLHDAHCVIRCLIKKRALLAGGGAPEIEIAHALTVAARSLAGTEAVCWRAFADALEVVPTTLAENAGLDAIRVVTELRARHAAGERNAGVSVRRGGVKGDITEENVLQPLLVSTSAVELASETVKLILRIDDIALSR